jgi:hypothetical protein
MSGPSSSTVTSAPGALTPAGGTSNLNQLAADRLETLYGEGNPAVYQGARSVSASAETSKALTDAYNVATGSNKLLTDALAQQGKTISGDYLGLNPFFTGAFAAAKTPIEEAFQQQIQNITSQASRAGRYGSGAAQQLQERAATGLARELSNIGGTLAFRGYESERGRQEAASALAPSLSQARYADAEKALRVGQIKEGYTQAQNLANMQKFQEEEMAPYIRLQTFLSGMSGIPTGQTVSTKYEPNKLLEGLGVALAGSTLLSDPNSPLKGALSGLGEAGTAVFDWLKGTFGTK